MGKTLLIRLSCILAGFWTMPVAWAISPGNYGGVVGTGGTALGTQNLPDNATPSTKQPLDLVQGQLIQSEAPAPQNLPDIETTPAKQPLDSIQIQLIQLKLNEACLKATDADPDQDGDGVPDVCETTAAGVAQDGGLPKQDGGVPQDPNAPANAEPNFDPAVPFCADGQAWSEEGGACFVVLAPVDYADAYVSQLEPSNMTPTDAAAEVAQPTEATDPSDKFDGGCSLVVGGASAATGWLLSLFTLPPIGGLLMRRFRRRRRTGHPQLLLLLAGCWCASLFGGAAWADPPKCGLSDDVMVSVFYYKPNPNITIYAHAIEVMIGEHGNGTIWGNDDVWIQPGTKTACTDIGTQQAGSDLEHLYVCKPVLTQANFSVDLDVQFPDGHVCNFNEPFNSSKVFTFKTTPTSSTSTGKDDYAALYDYLFPLDSDAILALKDNCPFVTNGDQADGDADGIGDVCENAPKPTPSPAEDQGPEDADADSETTEGGDVVPPPTTDEGADGTGSVCPDGALWVAAQAACLVDIDTDGDTTVDGADPCPTDDKNTCNVKPNNPPEVPAQNAETPAPTSGGGGCSLSAASELPAGAYGLFSLLAATALLAITRQFRRGG